MPRRLVSTCTLLLGIAAACGGSLSSNTDAGSDAAPASSSSGSSGSSGGSGGSSSGGSSGSSSSSSSSSGGSSSSSSGVSHSCNFYAGPSSCAAGSLSCDATTCCPPSLPFSCMGTGQCYATQGQALSFCPYGCEACSDQTRAFDAGLPGDASSCGAFVPGGDGGENVACESQIAMSCGTQQCACSGDANVTDAGDPLCAAYASCVFAEVWSLRTDGSAGGLPLAESTCATDLGVSGPSRSFGDALFACIANGSKTATVCLP